jgi:glucosamine 6-phosphate synthetase-like amidotransferase/phosphosugar isomerase protein
MCGLFGFVGAGGPDLKRLQAIAEYTEATRGGHAFGFAWIDTRGRLHCYKSHGRISANRKSLYAASNAVFLVGHCRWATHGSPIHNGNNHPHPADGGWIVHNGVIARHKEIAFDYGILTHTECDSEVIGGLLETIRGTLAERASRAIGQCGPKPQAMLGLWKPGRLVATAAGNPLCWRMIGNALYIASTAESLGTGAKAFPAGTTELRMGKRDRIVRAMPLVPIRPYAGLFVRS